MIEFVVILVLIGINGLFALAEIAFVSSKREFFEEAASQGNKRAKRILSFMDAPDKFLSSIQVGITLIGIVSGAASGVTLTDDMLHLLERIAWLAPYAYPVSLVLIVGTVTYLSILFGELVPKTIALRDPEKAILLMIPAINAFSVVTYPAVALLSGSTRLFLRLTGLGLTGLDQEADPLKEILGIAKMAAIKNKIHKEQAQIITNTLRMGKMTIASIMVKRENIKWLSVDLSLNQALLEAHIHHHTRYPLVNANDLNQVLGYVNFKDIINAIRIDPLTPSLKTISRPLIAISDKTPLPEVLRKLISTHQHIAIVKDAAQNVVGMVTLENILEIVVGDIQDEFDLLPEFFYNITEERWLVGGGMRLSQLHQHFAAIPDDPHTTIGQWLGARMKGALKVESLYTQDDLTFYIRKISRARVYEVIIERVQPVPAGTGAAR